MIAQEDIFRSTQHHRRGCRLDVRPRERRVCAVVVGYVCAVVVGCVCAVVVGCVYAVVVGCVWFRARFVSVPERQEEVIKN